VADGTGALLGGCEDTEGLVADVQAALDAITR
jgi:hypothetical protein